LFRKLADIRLCMSVAVGDLATIVFRERNVTHRSARNTIRWGGRCVLL